MTPLSVGSNDAVVDRLQRPVPPEVLDRRREAITIIEMGPI
ncbi:MAG: hypothetical protein WKF96_15450 [Solirubrobacteraceae bacterium]